MQPSGDRLPLSRLLAAKPVSLDARWFGRAIVFTVNLYVRDTYLHILFDKHKERILEPFLSPGQT